MFYCREEELCTMNQRYEKGRFECIVIYGRRRVGKTALINEFCKGKPTVYFSALNASSQENLEALSKAIYNCQNPDSTSAPTYQSYGDALDAISTIATEKRLVFEKMCREYLLRYADDLPVLLNDVGQWWGTDSKTRKEVQLDLVGTPVEGNAYLIGSCKYRNEKIGIEELELLHRYASVFRKDGIFYYYIFSKGGFTPALLEAEKRGAVKLLTQNDLYQ